MQNQNEQRTKQIAKMQNVLFLNIYHVSPVYYRHSTYRLLQQFLGLFVLFFYPWIRFKTNTHTQFTKHTIIIEDKH